jgi:hydroxymethylbilane synthase
MVIRVGSRGSRLALTQAELAVERLRRPGIELALVPITTAGDRDRTKPFGQIGERGVFVKELEEALLAGRIDVAVHSAKDMTSTDTEGLAVGAYPAREDPRDALCGAPGLRPGMRVGTASVRRRAQLLALEPTLSIEPLRGNVDTRLRKRGERGLDAVVLAATGSASPARSAAASSRTSCCPRPVRALSRSRCAPARRRSPPPPTTRRRAAAWRPSAGASRRSAAAASRPSPPTMTAPC